MATKKATATEARAEGWVKTKKHGWVCENCRRYPGERGIIGV